MPCFPVIVRQVEAKTSDSEQDLGSCCRVGQHWAQGLHHSLVLVLVSPTQASSSTLRMSPMPPDPLVALALHVPSVGWVHCNHPGDNFGTETGTGLIAKDGACAYLPLFCN